MGRIDRYVEARGISLSRAIVRCDENFGCAQLRTTTGVVDAAAASSQGGSGSAGMTPTGFEPVLQE